MNHFDGVGAKKKRLLAAGFIDVREKPMDGWQPDIVHIVLHTFLHTFLAARAQ